MSQSSGPVSYCSPTHQWALSFVNKHLQHWLCWFFHLESLLLASHPGHTYPPSRKLHPSLPSSDITSPLTSNTTDKHELLKFEISQNLKNHLAQHLLKGGHHNLLKFFVVPTTKVSSKKRNQKPCMCYNLS